MKLTLVVLLLCVCILLCDAKGSGRYSKSLQGPRFGRARNQDLNPQFAQKNSKTLNRQRRESQSINNPRGKVNQERFQKTGKFKPNPKRTGLK